MATGGSFKAYRNKPGRIETYKPDWKEALQRMCDWWEGKPTDRVPASVTAPREGVHKPSAKGNLVDRYTDPETIFCNLDVELASTFYGGESFPHHLVYIGAVPMSAYLGCELDFHEETVWQLPIFDSWEAVHDITFDTQNKWWRLTCDLTRKSVEHARGRYLVSGCLVSSISDVIANMFRHRPTLMAMIERPEMIKELRDKMLVWFKKMYDELYEIAAPYQYGYFDWLHLWAPGHICTLQSDISCMISPVMFSDLFIEEITEEAKYVDYSFYHLDGPDAIKHIDTLLEIEELDGIQWVPGAAASSDPVDWIDLFRHIQYAGKKFFIYSSPGCIKPILNAISRDRVYFSIRCSDEEEAQEVLLELGRIGC